MQKNYDVLWAATVRTKSFEKRLIAAVVGGFPAMTLFPIDVQRFTAGGLSIPEMRRISADYGVRLAVLDPLTQWLPDWQSPASLSSEDLAFVNFEETAFLKMAEMLGVESINVIETFGRAYPFDVFVENFARICDRAHEFGLRVHLEFMPFSSIPDLATAWEIVRQANRPNGGLLIDSWHYFRGTPNPSLLASIPGDLIFRVQLADALTKLHRSLFEDLMHHRVLPGDGEMDVLGLMQILKRIGGLSSVGLELFSDAFDELSPSEVGHRAQANFDQLVLAMADRPA
ncbi:MAG TPA: sugar phosphate isomerase/epimerase family protein [Coleofasciculaceae cyanobacterium]|jgi:4-hydroxyphenylpyruvate dioxygenase